jgi:DNA-binding NtrC family response regulator
VIQRHGGTIEIDSKLNRGTTVRFLFPIRRSADQPCSSAAPRAAPTGRRILVVEDEEPLRQILSAYLAVDHHEVETASGGSEGLAKFRCRRFDVVVTDRAMPDMSGDQLAASIKRLVPTQPVILLTGFGEVMIADGTQPDAVDLVTSKPVTLAGLREALSQVLDRLTA